MDLDNDDLADGAEDSVRDSVKSCEEHLSSSITSRVISEPSSASSVSEEDDQTESDSDDDSECSSFSRSVSSGSLELNPNSSLDNLDLPAISLLKEIFPEESTDSLRELHYQNILANKSSVSFTTTVSSIGVGQTSMYDDLGDENVEGNQERQQIRQQLLEPIRRNLPLSELPDQDFLRLPKSVAVLREGQDTDGTSIQKYEFIQDLEAGALQEYHLAAATSSGQTNDPRRNPIEYSTYVVDRDERWGLGMTLQPVVEEGDHLRKQQRQYAAPDSLMSRYTVIRFGLLVNGFVPDPKKIERGEIVSKISQSPAAAAGIRCNDVLIGINGTAFLLRMPLSSSFTVDRRSYEYNSQKQKIVELIQNSPSPVVLHIRRKRLQMLGPNTVMSAESDSIRKSFSEHSVASLLDTTTFDLEENDIDSTYVQQTTSELYEQQHTPQQQREEPRKLQQGRSSTPLRPSASSAFHKPSPAPTPLSKSSSAERHPLAVALARRKLIRSGEDEWRITRRLQEFTDRARQWESSNSLRIALGGTGSGGNLGSLVPHFDPCDLPPDMASLMVFSQEKLAQGGTIVQQEGSDTRAANPNSDARKNQLEAGQNFNYPQSHALVTACTRSTPPLPLNSPLIPFEYLQAFYGFEKAQAIRSQVAATTSSSSESGFVPRKLFWSEESSERHRRPREFQNKTIRSDDIAWIPLHGIRKSLSARILNSFVEGEESNRNSDKKFRIAYTIWVYDVESGSEWYAPIRYWEDFSDLRGAALDLLPSGSNLHKELSNLKFSKEPTIPSNSNSNSGWGVSPMSPFQQRRRQKKNEEFNDARQQTCQLLEEFLRELIGIIYTCDPLHPNTAEIALYVQSFLGVDAGLDDNRLPLSYERTFSSIPERREDEVQQLLKRSIQRYSWRIFLLHTMKAIVGDFVDAARSRGPKLHEIESMETQNNASVKTRAMNELVHIQKFLDQLVDLVLDGCNDDLRLIAARHEYSAIHHYIVDESYWDRLVRESVREQVEIEVYVPLRSVVSRLIVNGWRHEDAEVLFKIKVNRA